MYLSSIMLLRLLLFHNRLRHVDDDKVTLTTWLVCVCVHVNWRLFVHTSISARQFQSFFFFFHPSSLLSLLLLLLLLCGGWQHEKEAILKVCALSHESFLWWYFYSDCYEKNAFFLSLSLARSLDKMCEQKWKITLLYTFFSLSPRQLLFYHVPIVCHDASSTFHFLSFRSLLF